MADREILKVSPERLQGAQGTRITPDKAWYQKTRDEMLSIMDKQKESRTPSPSAIVYPPLRDFDK